MRSGATEHIHSVGWFAGGLLVKNAAADKPSSALSTSRLLLEFISIETPPHQIMVSDVASGVWVILHVSAREDWSLGGKDLGGTLCQLMQYDPAGDWPAAGHNYIP